MRPRGCTRTIAVGLFLLVASVGTVLAQEGDPFVGTWKLNLAKSTLRPGRALQSKTLTFEDRGGIFLVWNETTDAKGNWSTARAAFKRDGKDYPFAARGQQAEVTLAYKTVDANTAAVTIKENGKIRQTGTETVSRDGKTFTWTFKATDEQGQSFTVAQVYDRVQ